MAGLTKRNDSFNTGAAYPDTSSSTWSPLYGETDPAKREAAKKTDPYKSLKNNDYYKKLSRGGSSNSSPVGEFIGNNLLGTDDFNRAGNAWSKGDYLGFAKSALTGAGELGLTAASVLGAPETGGISLGARIAEAKAAKKIGELGVGALDTAKAAKAAEGAKAATGAVDLSENSIRGLDEAMAEKRSIDSAKQLEGFKQNVSPSIVAKSTNAAGSFGRIKNYMASKTAAGALALTHVLGSVGGPATLDAANAARGTIVAEKVLANTDARAAQYAPEVTPPKVDLAPKVNPAGDVKVGKNGDTVQTKVSNNTGGAAHGNVAPNSQTIGINVNQDTNVPTNTERSNAQARGTSEPGARDIQAKAEENMRRPVPTPGDMTIPGDETKIPLTA